ncbi:A24 family peptidase [Nocardia sp. CDC153]|uniref:A24 family peptidase n=1 Tax=Nocardia sp. CDC153 TaxID=3112167 RepID=UPI002DBB3A4A|nr:A24 family peptidase [Nocardia sp. CDC153]MEC3953467.1 A24 family peptidase [Nocardia sp. CDC153]
MDPLATLVFTIWCLALSTADLRCRRLPNALTLPGAAVALGYGFAVGKPTLALLGASLLALPYLVVHLCDRRALGAGDVKLALGLGAVTALAGPQAWAWAALTAPMLTAAAGIGQHLAQQWHDFPIEHGEAEPRRGHSASSRFVMPRSPRSYAITHPAMSWAGSGGRMAGSVGGMAGLAHGASMGVASVIAVVAGL